MRYKQKCWKPFGSTSMYVFEVTTELCTDLVQTATVKITPIPRAYQAAALR